MWCVNIKCIMDWRHYDCYVEHAAISLDVMPLRKLNNWSILRSEHNIQQELLEDSNFEWLLLTVFVSYPSMASSWMIRNKPRNKTCKTLISYSLKLNLIFFIHLLKLSFYVICFLQIVFSVELCFLFENAKKKRVGHGFGKKI